MVRIKHRYLLLNILYPESKDAINGSISQSPDYVPYTVHFRRPTPDRMDAKILLRMIRDGVSELFGDYGSGVIAGSLQVKYFSPATNTAIVRVSRDHYRLVWAALTFVTRLPKPLDLACVMQIVRVSGTIKKAEQEAIRRARLSIKHAQQQSANFTTTRAKRGGIETKELAEDDVSDEFPQFADGIEDLDDADDDDENEDND